MSSVRLVALTQPVNVAATSAEELVAYCARVSNPANQANHGTAAKLVSYLVRNHHWSPFEMAHAVLEIETTRDIARQILRHRSFSFQEFSQRYAAVQEPPVLREARLQDEKNRQASLVTEDQRLKAKWLLMQEQVAKLTDQCYNWALDHGIAKEVARSVLPEGLTASKLYMAGSVRSWIHYIQLRTSAGTQLEHRLVAGQCKDTLLAAMPSLAEVLHAD